MQVSLYNLAELSLFRGQVTPDGVTVSPVQELVALGLTGNSTLTKQYLDCNGTNNAIENLQWNKENGAIRLTITARSNARRLDLSSANDEDEGIYTCRDTVTGNSMSINVTKGEERSY